MHVIFAGPEFAYAAKLPRCSDRQKELVHCCDGMALERKTEKMPATQKEQLAAEAIDRWGDFQESLSSVKRKYPIHQFQAFWSATKRYAELTRGML